MLTIHTSGSGSPLSWRADLEAPRDPLWIDLVDPSEDERREAERMLGTSLPTRDQTSALELSNRLKSSEEALRLNIPSFVRAEAGEGPLTPLGFVLTPTMLASIRYADSLAFQQVGDRMRKADAPQDGSGVLVALLQGIVNVGADRIEAVSAELSKLSRAVFADKPKHHDLLRSALFKVGRMQRQITQIRLSLLGVSRVVTYLCGGGPSWVDSSHHALFKTIQTDIGALTEFDQQLSDRLQFLLDAVLGFINNNQNDIMKVLTVVSVATVPPMILAGIWGMNFKSIPEYNWTHGYAFGLSAIALSMVLPLLWFKYKRWI